VLAYVEVHILGQTMISSLFSRMILKYSYNIIIIIPFENVYLDALAFNNVFVGLLTK